MGKEVLGLLIVLEKTLDAAFPTFWLMKQFSIKGKLMKSVQLNRFRMVLESYIDLYKNFTSLMHRKNVISFGIEKLRNR